jgi:hypothetical protein
MGATALLVGGGGIVLLSQWTSQSLPLEQRASTLWMTSLGTILFLFCSWSLSTGNMPVRLERILTAIAGWLSVEIWQFFLLLLSPLMVLLVPLSAGSGAKMANPEVALAAWGLAIGMAILAGYKREEKTPLERSTLA